MPLAKHFVAAGIHAKPPRSKTQLERETMINVCIDHRAHLGGERSLLRVQDVCGIGRGSPDSLHSHVHYMTEPK